MALPLTLMLLLRCGLGRRRRRRPQRPTAIKNKIFACVIKLGGNLCVVCEFTTRMANATSSFCVHRAAAAATSWHSRVSQSLCCYVCITIPQASSREREKTCLMQTASSGAAQFQKKSSCLGKRKKLVCRHLGRAFLLGGWYVWQGRGGKSRREGGEK